MGSVSSLVSTEGHEPLAHASLLFMQGQQSGPRGVYGLILSVSFTRFRVTVEQTSGYVYGKSMGDSRLGLMS